VAALVVLALVLVAAGVLGYRWSQTQYYVAAAGDRVAVYRGVQADIPGLRMHRVAVTTDITLESLKDYPAEQVRSGISADSKTDAMAIVARLQGLATVCPTATPSPEPSPTAGRRPSQQPSQQPSAKPTVQATKRPSKAPSPTAATDKPVASGQPSPSAAPTSGPSGSATPSPTLTPPDCVEATS
jgi:protein phosphatase